MTQKNIKQLYKDFCKKNNRDYFINYNEMITVLQLNPNSSRRTNNNIVKSFCQIEKDGQKIYLKNFVKTKQFNKAIKTIENSKYSFNMLIREFFLLLNQSCEKIDFFVDGKYYLTKSNARKKLGFIKPGFTSAYRIKSMVNEINLVRDKLLADSNECTFDFVEEYLFNMKSMANTYIKNALAKIPELNVKEIYVLFDSLDDETYITDMNIIRNFKAEQELIFISICAKHNKNIAKVTDLIFFKEESNEYYQNSLEYLQQHGYEDVQRFEQGYQISIKENVTCEPLGMTINEVKKRISKKFHQTMVTHIKHQREKFCSISETQELDNIAEMQIEQEQNNILYRNRTKKLTIQRASNDNIINTGLINFLLIHSFDEIKYFADELEEYILPEIDKTKNANREMKKIIRKIKDKYKYIIEDNESHIKEMQRKEKIEKHKMELYDKLNDKINEVLLI